MRELSLLAAAREASSRDAIALIAPTREWTFAQLGERVARTIGALASRGVGRGSRVAVVAPNSEALVALLFALIEISAVVVPIHPRLTAGERARLVAAARPMLVLTEADLASLDGEAMDLETRAEAEDPLAIVFTSGTSGTPKGAVLPRRAFVASAHASAKNLGFYDDDRWLLCMPLCHVGGLSILTRCLLAMRPVVLVARFDARSVIDAIAQHRATIVSVVPTMLHALLDEDDRGVLAKLRVALVGGAAASPELLARAADRRVPALTTYGLTEACSQVTVQAPRDARTQEAGSGTPLEGVEVRVDARGHVLVRGATLMLGYDLPENKLDPARDQDGFFDTGDLGELDPYGRLHIHARRTDLIVTGGENVYPTEVEGALEAIDGVARALVFGAPDARWGQIVCALFVARDGANREAVLARAKEKLAPHKRPRRVAFVDALPTNTTGKLDRRAALALYAGDLVTVP